MKRNGVLTFRLPQPVFDALVRERHERHLNVSGWARAAVLDAFQRDFPNAARGVAKPSPSTAELDWEFPPSISEILAEQLLEVRESDRPAEGRLRRWTSRLRDAAPSWLRFSKETS